MDHSAHNKLVSFIWNIADDCLRDVYVRGKYRDVILPMVVLRRLDALLEPTKAKVLEEVRFQKEDAGFTELDPQGLCDASGFVFYNTSTWTLTKLKDTASNSTQLLEANFMEYLDGFSPNVKEIIEKFKLRAQVRHMVAKNVLLDVLEKFCSPYINLTHAVVNDTDGRRLPALTNLGMGYVFEELIRKFNEENNEEAGEHFTPREVIDLMTHIVFDPVKDQLPPVMTIYDPACGSGGMLTEAQNFIKDPEGGIKASGDVYLFGKEINDETYAICKSDMMIKGNDPENIKCGSTLSTDEFAGQRFDFMLSNPPYGKSWASEQKYIKDGTEVIDPRFVVRLKDYWGAEEAADATPRSSDGQLLFLMEMVSKMKPPTVSPLGSRIASVHNGSSLFTGDAGGGESNIRRYLIENDLLEAIIQLPNNIFYNTGITTYIWLLSNHKAPERRGTVQLIDASQLYAPLRKNLGAKNCELKPEHITAIMDCYRALRTVESAGPGTIAAQVFNNADFGYYKVTVERPQRLKAQLTPERVESLRYDRKLAEPMQWAYATYGDRVYTDLKALEKDLLRWCEEQGLELTTKQRSALLNQANWQDQRRLCQIAADLMKALGQEVYMDYNAFTELVDRELKTLGHKLSASERKTILQAVSEYDAQAEKVVKKLHKLKGEKLEELLAQLGCTLEQLVDHGYHPTGKAGEYLEYETETDLRDTENVPLGEDIHAYFRREVRPYVAEAWLNLPATKIGYEISFNRYFYRHQPLRSLAEVSDEILQLEQQSEGLIHDILNA